MSLQARARPDLCREVHDAARRARVASRVLALLPTVAKDQALHSAATAIVANRHVEYRAPLKAYRALQTRNVLDHPDPRE